MVHHGARRFRQVLRSPGKRVGREEFLHLAAWVAAAGPLCFKRLGLVRLVVAQEARWRDSRPHFSSTLVLPPVGILPAFHVARISRWVVPGDHDKGCRPPRSIVPVNSPPKESLPPSAVPCSHRRFEIPWRRSKLCCETRLRTTPYACVWTLTRSSMPRACWRGRQGAPPLAPAPARGRHHPTGRQAACAACEGLQVQDHRGAAANTLHQGVLHAAG